MRFISAVGPQDDIINDTGATIDARALALYEHATARETMVQFRTDDADSLTRYAADKYGLRYTVVISAPGVVGALVRVS